jgi:protein-S-isoprenylcysteine O-methyltransferase Ste14
VEVSPPVLLGAALVFALVVGPWLAVVAARLTDSDAVQPGRARMALLTAVFAQLLVGAVLFAGLRPATVAYAWAAGAAVVLGRSTWPATGCRTGSPIPRTPSAAARCSSTPSCSGRGRRC